MGLTLAALLTVGATLSATATFEAPAPGADLEALGDAGSLISLVQGQEHLLWTALTGTVTSYTALGWPSSDGEVELGGAMVIVRPADGSAGGPRRKADGARVRAEPIAHGSQVGQKLRGPASGGQIGLEVRSLKRPDRADHSGLGPVDVACDRLHRVEIDRI